MPTNARISITGFGEPTLAGDFDDILKMSVDNGSVVHFVTNASLLNFERIEKLTRTPVGITISFDGATRETFESVREGANFELILEKLAMIKKLRDIHLTQVSSYFCFNFVALRKNIDELADVVRIAHRYDISHVGVADYAFNENEFDEQSLRFEPERANAAIARARAVAEELGVTLHTPPEYLPVPPPVRALPLWKKVLRSRRIFPEKNRFPSRCNSPWSEPYIHTDGIVTPCCASNDYLGDLKKQSFEEIWNGWRYRLLRWRIHSVVPPNSCRRCFVCWGINGGNHGNAMAKEGLLVKAFYWFEFRLVRLWEKGKDRWKKLRAKSPAKAGGECGSDPAPNYYKGRPMTEKNRPE